MNLWELCDYITFVSWMDSIDGNALVLETYQSSEKTQENTFENLVFFQISFLLLFRTEFAKSLRKKVSDKYPTGKRIRKKTLKKLFLHTRTHTLCKKRTGQKSEKEFISKRGQCIYQQQDRERKRNSRPSTTQIEIRQPYNFAAKNQIKLGSIHKSISCVRVDRGSDVF